MTRRLTNPEDTKAIILFLEFPKMFDFQSPVIQMLINSLCTLSINNLLSIKPPISLSSSPSLLPSSTHGGTGHYHNTRRKRGQVVKGGGRILCGLLPVDPWASAIDPQTLTNLLFAFSLFSNLGFLYFVSRVGSAPKLTLFGFHFLLVFVGATIPVGIYEKAQYGASLSNVDWLHGGAESLLALSNLFVALGIREAKEFQRLSILPFKCMKHQTSVVFCPLLMILDFHPDVIGSCKNEGKRRRINVCFIGMRNMCMQREFTKEIVGLGSSTSFSGI